MLKKLLPITFVIILSFTSIAYAEETNNQDNQTVNESIHQKIINMWNKDAAPFFQGVACSFKTDVWDKANNWLEKNNIKKVTITSEEKKDENKDENKKSCTFFDTLHKAITGKESTTSTSSK